MSNQHNAGNIHPLAALEAIVRWCDGKRQGRAFEISFFPTGTLPGYQVGIFDMTVFDDGGADEIGADGATLEEAILATYEMMQDAEWFARNPRPVRRLPHAKT